ncbi:IgGFc-binding protein-like [Notothenia coriiceps]|uniref:IgGFc-binding protein-like n=1 Tax=Notothenia coriiceps TaxID=8208 RepID=A0A6I9NZY2_9TELE|nr:PREDICTED: IgGFc-binding protein-like [Notothenia coriiceps]
MGNKASGVHCPANSMYSVTASAVQSAALLISTLLSKAPPSEGCVCNPGYLQSQDGCVPLAQCGCLSEQQYIASGQKFYPKPDCMKLCECRGGMVSCEDKPCQKGKSCGVREGVRGCYDNLKTPGNKG